MDINSQRLSLRPWHADDLPSLIAMNRDPAVNLPLGGLSLVENSASSLENYQRHFAHYGWGVFHLTDRNGSFVGLAGLQPARATLPYAPATEAVWRLRPEYWGQGLASEALKTILDALPATSEITEVLAVVAMPNLRSAATARRLGFRHDPERDFIYPDTSLDPALRPHRVFVLPR